MDVNSPYLRLECPLNKEGKKDKDMKKKKKAMMIIQSDSDPFSSENEPEMDIKANLCLMAIDDDGVYIDNLDDFDRLRNKYECLFNDFEKLRHRCKDYKKITVTLTLDIKNAKHDYDVVVDSKNEFEKCFVNLKSENEVLRLELEEKHKALEKSLNENAALKLTINEKKSIHITSTQIDHLERSMFTSLAMNVVEKATLLFIILLKLNALHLRRFGFLKVPMS